MNEEVLEIKRLAAFKRSTQLDELLRSASPAENSCHVIAALKRFKGSCYQAKGAWWISWVPLRWMKHGGWRRYRRFVKEETARRWLVKITLQLERGEAARQACKLYPDPIDEVVAEMNAGRSPDAPRATRKDATAKILREGPDLTPAFPVSPKTSNPKAGPALN